MRVNADTMLSKKNWEKPKREQKENNMGNKLKFVRMTSTITIYGVGNTFEEAKTNAKLETIDYAYKMSTNSKDYLEYTNPTYEEVSEEETNFDKGYLEDLEQQGE